MWYFCFMDWKYLQPSSTSPAWLQAVRMTVKATSSGDSPSISILLNRFTASSPRPWIDNPCIIEQYKTRSRLGLSSNNFDALSMFPHFAFISRSATISWSHRYSSSLHKNQPVELVLNVPTAPKPISS